MTQTPLRKWVVFLFAQNGYGVKTVPITPGTALKLYSPRKTPAIKTQAEKQKGESVWS